MIEERQNGTPTAQYVWDGTDRLVERDDHDPATSGTALNRRFYVQQDADGNVTSLTDAWGTVVERYVYSAYGVVTVLNPDGTVRGDGTAASSSYGWRILHQGLRLDPATGTYYNRGREYDPAEGRFLQQDPAGYIDGASRYQYEIGNPASYGDPSGLYVFNDPSPGPVTATPGGTTSAVGDIRGSATTSTPPGGPMAGNTSAAGTTGEGAAAAAEDGGAEAIGEGILGDLAIGALVWGEAIGNFANFFADNYAEDAYAKAGPTHVPGHRPKPKPTPAPKPKVGPGPVGPTGGRDDGKPEDKPLPIFHVHFTRTFWIAAHDAWAIFAEHKPSVLTRRPGGRKAIRPVRRQALAGNNGLMNGYLDSLDEYPFASSMEGGPGASVWPVPSAENDMQGQDLSAFLRNNGVLPGQKYGVVVEP